MGMKQLTYSPDTNSTNSLETTSNYVNSVSLAANVAQTFVKPLGSSKVLFSTNFIVGDSITFGAVKLTAVASSPSSAQFIPGVSLAATLASLVTQFQAIPQAPAGTYSVTDANSSITFANALSATPVVTMAAKATGVNLPSQIAGARFCRLSAGALFYYSATATAAIAVGAITNGAGSISVPATVQPMFNIDDILSISVIAPANCTVSAEFWA